MQPVVIVLAAGQARRFRAAGGATNKLEAVLDGRPVLEHVLASVRASGLPLQVVRCADGPGMGDSIAAGVRATPAAGGWLILPGDLPLVTAGSIRAVAQALAGHSVVMPYHAGNHGHPVGFRRECGEMLASLSGDEGARAVVRHFRQRNQVLELALDDPGILLDVDTPDDLARAAVWLQAQGRAGHGKH